MDNNHKRILLLNSCVLVPSIDRLQRSWKSISIGIASIAGYLRSLGHDVIILDSRLELLDTKALARKIVASEPQYVGYTAFTEEIFDAASIADEVKKCDSKIINIIGGCHVSAIPEDTLQEFPAFDIAVVGEGELPLGRILAGESWNDIPGVVTRDKAGLPVVSPGNRIVPQPDNLPFPAWESFAIKQYRTPLFVELARACPFQCTFCFKTVGRQVRYKSPERILDELEYCVKRLGISHLYFSTNGTWPLAREHALCVCDGILSRNLKIRWSTSTRIDCIDQELLALMRRCGCDFIDFGIESASKEILRVSQKQTSPEMFEQVIRQCHELGFDIELDFLLGLPQETPETLGETYNFIKKIRNYSTIANFAVLIPFPGTDIFSMALRGENGLRLLSRNWRLYTKQTGVLMERDTLSSEELRRWQAKMYRAYYLLSLKKPFQILMSKNARELISLNRYLSLFKSI